MLFFPEILSSLPHQVLPTLETILFFTRDYKAILSSQWPHWFIYLMLHSTLYYQALSQLLLFQFWFTAQFLFTLVFSDVVFSHLNHRFYCYIPDSLMITYVDFWHLSSVSFVVYYWSVVFRYHGFFWVNFMMLCPFKFSDYLSTLVNNWFFAVFMSFAD